MLRMSRMFELLLQVHKCTGSLNQSFEVLRILSSHRFLQPNLLENVVGFVVFVLIPAVEIGAIIRMIGNGPAIFRVATLQRSDELGNSLAFAH